MHVDYETRSRAPAYALTGAAAHDGQWRQLDSIGQVEKVESDYYAFMGFDRANAESVLSHYLPFFADGPVLELACGPGRVPRPARGRGASLQRRRHR